MDGAKLSTLIVTLVLSVPLGADVTITAENLGSGKIAIHYDSTGEAELVRAFALDISTDGIITEVSDFVSGPDNGGYGIFPTNFSRFITVDPQSGEVDDWGVHGYTPVVDANDVGAAGGLGDHAITIEMGSLYNTNAPGTTGVLCTVTIENGSYLIITSNPVRGGVVLENGKKAVVHFDTGWPPPPPPFPDTNPAYDDWVALGMPVCWTTKSWGGSGYQCDGDIDGKDSGFPATYRVYLGDLNILIANWQKKMGDPTLDPCADVDHKDSGFPARYRVYLGDLNILVANWRKKDSQLPGDCPRPY